MPPEHVLDKKAADDTNLQKLFRVYVSKCASKQRRTFMHYFVVALIEFSSIQESLWGKPSIP